MENREQANADWLRKLKSEGAPQAEAIEDLRRLLLRASLYTFSRNLHDLQHRPAEEMLALAEDCTQEALIAVLQQLDTFRGESRFTTWVYKFGVHKALETARRERWKNVSLDSLLDIEDRCDWANAGDSIDTALQAEIWKVIQEVICNELTKRQRQVVKWMVFDEVPMDIVTERLDTNRNAIYKVLHDARKRIRSRLNEHGYSTEEVMELFKTPAPGNREDIPEGDCQ